MINIPFMLSNALTSVSLLSGKCIVVIQFDSKLRLEPLLKFPTVLNMFSEDFKRKTRTVVIAVINDHVNAKHFFPSLIRQLRQTFH